MDKYLIDRHKLYWHLDRVAEWQERRVIAPIYLEISPVSKCNHRCIFCGIDFARDTGSSIRCDILCSRISEMAQSGVKSIMFAGEGEPLLHKDLPEFIRISRNSGIDVSVTSNGTLGNYDLWRDILPNLTWIRFSIDAGSAAIHANVHNVPVKIFDMTIKSIEQAVEVKKRFGLGVTLGVQFLIMNENIHDIENALRLFSGLEVDYISLKPYSLHPQMKRKKEVLYDDSMLNHIDMLVDKFRGSSAMNIIYRRESLTKYMNGDKLFTQCYALPFWGYISSTGDFYTCSVFLNDERFRTGNIYDNAMTDIFFGERRRESIQYGEHVLAIRDECRLNCRMARVNEFLQTIEHEPEHINFI
jgi:cyclic pyranopterin phosphate synthase